MEVPIERETIKVNDTPSGHQFTKNSTRWRNLAFVLLGAGIFLRLFHFFHNRSLWMDEMFLSMSFLKMNFWELATLPLEYQQKAPLGYLWLVKLSVVLFGTGDMAMRLIPLLCGIAALFFFIPVARYFLKPLGVAAAVGIMALSPHLVYHSVEAKQYSAELLCTVLALYLYTRFHKRTDYRSLFLWGFWGALVIWFSFSSIFVLSGIAGGVSLYFLIKRNWKSFALYLVPFSLWMFSFAVNYFIFTSKHADSGWLVLWFKHRGGFMPSDLTGSIGWLIKKQFHVFDFPMGLSWFSLPDRYAGNSVLQAITRMTIVHLSLFLVGLAYLFKKNLEAFFVLTFPLLLHLLATVLLIYPFYERLTVYLAPLLILMVVYGGERLINILITYINKRRGVQFQEHLNGNATKGNAFTASGLDRKWGIALLVLLLLGPLMRSTRQLVDTEDFGFYKHWDQRALYQHLNANFKPGDAVYVYWSVRVAYDYYNMVHPFKFDALAGKDHRFTSSSLNDYLQKVKADLEALSKTHKRVWVVYGEHLFVDIGDIDNQPPWYYHDSESHLKQKQAVIHSIGNQTDSYKTKEGINLFLFEMEKKR